MTQESATSHFVDGSLVPRRLLPLLDPLEKARVAVITSPPGFHKSELVRVWLEADAPHRLDESVHIIVFRGEGLAAERRARLREVIQDKSGLGRPAYYVIDNHESLGDPDFAHEMLDLVEHHPHMRVIFCGRTRPRAPLSSLSVRGQLIDIDVNHLRLGRDEVTELVNRHGPVDDAIVDLLMEEYQGWPIAIELIANQHLTWDSVPQLADVIGGFLDEEVLQDLSADERRFLTDVATLPELTPASASHLSEAPDAIARLTKLAAQGVPMRWGAANHVTLYPALRHHLMRQVEEEDPERAAVANRRAAFWLHQQGSVIEAVRHASAALDRQLVADLLCQEVVLRLGDDAADLEELLEELAPAVDTFTITLLRMAVLAVRHPTSIPVSSLASLRTQLPEDASPGLRARFYATCLTVLRQRGYRDSHGLLEEIVAFEAARQPGDLSPSDEALLLVEHGYWLGVHDRLHEAIAALDVATTSARLAGMHWVAEFAASQRAWFQTFTGGAGRIRRAADEALLSAERRGRVDRRLVGLARLALGGVALDLGDVAEAERQSQLYRQLEGETLYSTSIFASAFEAALRDAQGQTPIAVMQLQQEVSDLDLLPPMQALTIAGAMFSYSLAQGNPHEASEWLQRIRALPLVDSATIVWVYEARLLMATGELQRAFSQLSRRLADGGGVLRRHPKHAVHLQMLHGIAASSLGRNAEALSSFQRAGVLAERLGLDSPTARHTRLASVLHQDHVELTRAERKVVAALATGASLAEIAEELFISRNTLKTHLRRVYRKLGVSGRSAAVERVKVLGMPLDA